MDQRAVKVGLFLVCEVDRVLSIDKYTGGVFDADSVGRFRHAFGQLRIIDIGFGNPGFLGTLGFGFEFQLQIHIAFGIAIFFSVHFRSTSETLPSAPPAPNKSDPRFWDSGCRSPTVHLPAAGTPTPLKYILQRSSCTSYNFCSTMLNSTRRFISLPAAVSFVSMGFSSPKPTASIRESSTPASTRYAITASARSCDRFLL